MPRPDSSKVLGLPLGLVPNLTASLASLKEPFKSTLQDAATEVLSYNNRRVPPTRLRLIGPRCGEAPLD